MTSATVHYDDTFPAPLDISSPEAKQLLRGVTHIYTDLDGTLFAPGGRLLAAHDLSPSTASAEALVALKKAGIEVILVTGRNRSQGEEILRLLNLHTFYGELGCVIMKGFGAKAQISYSLGDWEHIVLEEGLAKGTLRAGTSPVDLIRQSGVIDRLMSEFSGKFELHNPYNVTREVTMAFRGNVDLEQAERLLSESPLPLQLYDNGVINPSVHTLVDCPEIHIYHLMPRGTGKGLAVYADMCERGLERSQTISVGDAVGDIEMGECTGGFVLVNNKYADYVVETYQQRREGQGGQFYCASEQETSEPSPRLTYGALFTTQGMTADGWTEFAHALLAARD